MAKILWLLVLAGGCGGGTSPESICDRFFAAAEECGSPASGTDTCAADLEACSDEDLQRYDDFVTCYEDDCHDYGCTDILAEVTSCAGT
jgi:hypothetical protein